MSKELDALADSLVKRIGELSKAENEASRREMRTLIDSLRDSVTAQIDTLRSEVHSEIAAVQDRQAQQSRDIGQLIVRQAGIASDVANIRETQSDHSNTLGAHSKQIAGIVSDLAHGEESFVALRAAQAMLDEKHEALERRLPKIAGHEIVAAGGSMVREVAKIAIGGGVAAGIIKLLHL